MFELGSKVIYGIHGICVIVDTEQRKVDRNVVSYFVLEPAEQPGTRFLVPMHNEAALAKLKPILTRPELEALLVSPAVRTDAWIEDENHRKQFYRELIGSADRTALLQMICTLHKKRQQLLSAGKKFHLCDDNFLRDAQRLLSAEFSTILEIPRDRVAEYVQSILEKDPVPGA